MCRNAFMYLNDIGNSRLKTLISHYKQHGAVPRDFLYRGRNNKAVHYDEAKHVVTFLQNVARIHALVLPGTVSGMLILLCCFFAVS